MAGELDCAHALSFIFIGKAKGNFVSMIFFAHQTTSLCSFLNCMIIPFPMIPRYCMQQFCQGASKIPTQGVL